MNKRKKKLSRMNKRKRKLSWTNRRKKKPKILMLKLKLLSLQQI